MKPKTLISLAAIVSILGLTAFFLTREKQPESGITRMGDLFLAKLPVNEIAAVAIASDNGVIHLRKSETVWQVEERNGYPADFSKITDLVRKLSRLKIGRTFQASEDALARQQLNDPTDAKIAKEQKGLRITLKNAQDNVLADLILGNPRETTAGTGGQYVRPSDSQTVSLVDDNFQFLGKTPQEWLKRDVVNLDQKTIVQVAGFDSKAVAPVFVLRREDPAKAPLLLNLPAGKTADPQKIDQLFEAMSPLKMEDVSALPQDKAQVKESSTPPARARLEYRLADGRVFTVFPYVEKAKDSQPEIYRVQVAVAYEPEPQPPAAQPADSDTSKAAAADEIARQVREMDSQLRPWIFTLAKWQFESLITQLDGLLQKKESTP
jgi:Domain of unknown function (DUF4340)